MSRSTPTIDLLIVDDDEYLQQDLTAYFSAQDLQVHCAKDANEALAALKNQVFAVAIVDVHLPDLSGLELLERIREVDPECEVIMLTGQGSIETAVEAMKTGAVDYLTKPVRLKELEAVVDRAAATHRLKVKNKQLQGALRREANLSPKMIGNSQAMQSVYRLIERTGPTDKTILIQGESGTGKELVARAIHEASAVADSPMIAVNCAALPEQLLESEMFGHEKGSFTGATSTKQGLFEIADGGTLFIDEIGELAPSLQAKLLRVLEDGTYRRVGSTKMRRANVRLIAATNRDLAQEVVEHRFREDLYYRINVLTISLPPLRLRGDDIRELVAEFCDDSWKYDDELIDQLKHYSWPGNIRQLKNALDRAKILAEDHRIELRNFPEDVQRELTGEAPISRETPSDLGELTRQHIEYVYRQQGGNKTSAARVLGVSRRTLYRLLEKYNINDM